MEFGGLEVFGGDNRSIGHKKHEMTQKRASTDVTDGGTDDLAEKGAGVAKKGARGDSEGDWKKMR
jgi:hypothetical protein